MKTFSSIILFLGLTSLLYSQDKGLQDAATKAFSDLKALAGMKEIQMPNLPSMEELNTARLGDMIPHSMIPLDRLQKFTGTDDPKSMLMKMDRVTFPVVGPETNVISSVEVEKVQNAWQTADLNNSSYVKAFDRVRKENNLKTSQCTLIRVPAFNLYFLGRDGTGGLEMALLNDKGFGDVAPKRFMPASQVLTQLNAVAKNYNGLPW